MEHLANASKSVPGRDARSIAGIMAAELDGSLRTRGRSRRRPGGAGARGGGRGRAAQADRAPVSDQAGAELYGEALLGVGDATGAVEQFRASLTRTPRRAASLLGSRAGRGEGGDEVGTLPKAATDFLAAWKRADASRPELAEARALAR